MEEDDKEDVFQAAADHLPSIVEKLSNVDLLYLYARFKQATAGPCNVPKPGMLEFQAKKKWNAWNDLRSMTKAQAKTEYVVKLRSCDPEWDTGAKKKSVSGRSVSRPMNQTDDEVNPDEHVLFQMCKDGDVTKLKQYSSKDFNIRDSDNRSLLHWACDRGHYQVVCFLLENSCDANAVDIELLTPLHYAALCGYKDIVEVLLKNGANRNAVDDSGDTPLDCAELKEIKELLSSLHIPS